ncbi:MAG: (d)CMP kinase [Lachnospiraceae bacterium]|nr:(d)CMP kinase [Lachnospiraceae bacterium]
MGFKIAIDGPAGAGKSTVAKRTAAEEGFIYVDTGAMYRAVALNLLRNGADLCDEEDCRRFLPETEVTIRHDEEGTQQVILNGEDVSRVIRTQEVSDAASRTSAYPAVREKLLMLQRSLAEEADVLMDGRDIGTVILPDAELKIFLTADARVRAKRRFDELTAAGQECVFDDILKEIIERDERDMNREISPLRQAEDAVVVDTSYMGIDEVVARIRELIRERREK